MYYLVNYMHIVHMFTLLLAAQLQPSGWYELVFNVNTVQKAIVGIGLLSSFREEIIAERSVHSPKGKIFHKFFG